MQLNQKTIEELKKLGVVLGYLFGSQARNQAGVLSDFDFAFIVDEKIEDKHQIRLKLINLLEPIVGRDKIDVIILNDKKIPLSLQYQVIKEGKIVLNEDDNLRQDFEYRLMKQYLDRKYYLDRYVDLKIRHFAKNGLKK